VASLRDTNAIGTHIAQAISLSSPEAYLLPEAFVPPNKDAMYRLRSRIVNFRVTDEELALLKTASALRGSRCLSDFARSVMLETANVPAPPSSHDACDSRIVSLEQRMDALESNFQTLQSAVVPESPAEKDR
jgi:hypothetical protein